MSDPGKCIGSLERKSGAAAGDLRSVGEYIAPCF